MITLVEYGSRIGGAGGVGGAVCGGSGRSCSCVDGENVGPGGNCGDDEGLLKAFESMSLTFSSSEDFCVFCFLGIAGQKENSRRSKRS